MGKMCESLRRHARRSAGVDLRDYTDLSGLLPMTDVLASLPQCLAPPPYRMTASGVLRDFIRSKTDLQALADMFYAGDIVMSENLLASAAGEIDQPEDYWFPLPNPLRDAAPRSSIFHGRSVGVEQNSAGLVKGVAQSPGAPYAGLDTFRFRRGEANDDDGAEEEEEPPAFDGPLAVLYELFLTPRGFPDGVQALCSAGCLASPLPVPSETELIAHLGSLTTPRLRRLSTLLDLRVPEGRWTAQMKNEIVVHPLAGKLRATLLAYSSFSDRRFPDEEGGGGAKRASVLVGDPNWHRPHRPPPLSR